MWLYGPHACLSSCVSCSPNEPARQCLHAINSKKEEDWCCYVICVFLLASPPNMPYIGMCPSHWEAIFLCLLPLFPLSPGVLFHLHFHFIFFYSFTHSALCLYPFIFPWLLIPTVDNILHLNTNKAICMTANQYQKSRDSCCVVCNISMAFMWMQYVLCEYQRGGGQSVCWQKTIPRSTWCNLTGTAVWEIS